MGNSKFWFYPDPPGNLLHEIDLGRTVTEMLLPSTNLRQAAATGFTGARTIVQWGGVETSRIRVTWSGTTAYGRTLRRRLLPMLNHLDRGGSVMFAVDADRFYAGFMANANSPGDTSFNVVPSMDSIVADVSLTDTEVVIRSANPRCLIESQLVSAHTESVADLHGFTVSPGLHFDYTNEAWALIRELGSWPALRLPEGERGRQHLTSDHEISFTLDLPVEEDETSLALQFAANGAPFAGATEGAADPALIGAAVGGWAF